MTLDTSLPISNKGANGTPATDSNGNPVQGVEVTLWRRVLNDTNSDGEGDEITDTKLLARTQTDSNGEFEFTSNDLPATYIPGNSEKIYYCTIHAVRVASGSGDPLDNGRIKAYDSDNESAASDYIAAYSLESNATYEWNPSTFSTGDSTWVDEIQSEAMDMYGDPQKTTFSDGTDAIQFDGADDFGQALQTFGNELDKSAIEFEIESSDFGGGWWGVGSSGSLPLIQIRFDSNESFGSEAGNVMCLIRDPNDNGLRFAPTDNPNLDDGNKHKVSFAFNDVSNNDAEMYIDGTSVPLTFAAKESSTVNSDFANDFGFAGRSTGGGSADNNLDARIGLIRIHNTPIATQTI